MPEESKKNQKRTDAKDQRKPRHGRRHEAQSEKKNDKKPEQPKETPRVMIPQKPPVYESPGPEFYQNLKRETDEILKITEEESSKYKKKEIQSNWSKYEMPIESYEDIDEQENLGADYEKLIQAPLSSGGHFQFKHEKSWDVNTGPSPYDKYFDINMESLTMALSTIPFYERNAIDQSIFTETDMLNMNNRATRYKQKYFNDKSYTTPEIEAQEKILNSLKENVGKASDIDAQQKILNKLKDNFDKNEDINENNDDAIAENITIISQDFTSNSEVVNESSHISLDLKDVPKSEIVSSPIDGSGTQDRIKDNSISLDTTKSEANVVNTVTIEPKITNCKIDDNEEFTFTQAKTVPAIKKTELVQTKKVEIVPEVKAIPAAATTVIETNLNPVIESPEDLEKWLDDFLDG